MDPNKIVQKGRVKCELGAIIGEAEESFDNCEKLKVKKRKK